MSKSILNKQQISQIITRLAYEILERNFEMERFILAGIAKSGQVLTELILNELKEIAPEKETLQATISIDKNNPTKKPITVNPQLDFSRKDVVIVVDDVLYTGKTLIYALSPFLNLGLAKIQTLVLVQRDYQNFPVKADLVGISLATTYREHVSVNLAGNAASVVIS